MSRQNSKSIEKNNRPSTIIGIAAVLGRVLDHYGLDKLAIAREVGIDTRMAYKANDRIEARVLQKVWKIAAERTGDDCLGLTYAELIQPASLCGLGLAWITSDSLRDSISRLVKFHRSVTTASAFTLDELDDCYRIMMHKKLKDPVMVSLDASIATIFQMCRITYGPDLSVDRVCISHPAPDCAEKFNQFFGVKVEFNATDDQLFFSKNIFEQPLTTSNPDLARMNDQVVIEYLEHFDRNNISMRVRAKIIEKLVDGVPHQAVIADELNMSLRNLQRKLQEENTSYKEILDETRLELSRQYLKGTDRSIIEIGFLLGFSEPSNFARAFRRWTGSSPLQYRESA